MNKDPNQMAQDEGLDAVRERAENAVAFDPAPPFSESALALRFVERHEHELRYVSGWGRWMRWDGSRWSFEQTLLATDLAHRICREAAIEMQESGANRSANPIASAKTVSGVERLAKAHRRVAATVDQWDKDPWLLNTFKGVVDLRTGEMREAKPKDYMTKMTAVAPDPNCSTDLWMSVLKRAMADDDEMVKYLQRVFGYALTGSTREETLHFAWGPGGNSKTKIVEAVSGPMGDYHTVTPMETFLASRHPRHPTEIADLCGARLVTAVETDEGRSWDEAKIKALTGGDKLKARFMQKDFFEFHPQFTPFIHGNAKPRLRKIDEGIRRRLHMIPFLVTIPEEERDELLGEKLKAEWPGILQWMILGCLEWQRIRLAPPDKVKNATKVYLDSQDAKARWIEECCTLDANVECPRTLLFESWKTWAEAANEFVGKQAEFYDELDERGYQPTKSSGVRGFRGIKPRYVHP